MNISAIALGGLQNAETKFERSAARLTAADPSDTVDLSSAAVDLLSSRNEFEANIKVMQTADRMYKQTLNLFG
jgi:flagellar hook protein FlgE